MLGSSWRSLGGPCGGVLVLTLLSACPQRGRSPLRPAEILKVYADALGAGRFDVAYGMLSSAERKRVTREAFVQHMKSRPADVKRVVELMRRGPLRIEVRAETVYGEGDRLVLRVEDGLWRISEDPTAFYLQRTPREALRSFVRAMTNRRYGIVLRFVPRKWRSAMTEQKVRELWEGKQRAEVEQMLQELRQHLDDKIITSGNRATMPYGAGKAVQFVLEDGTWKIEDPD